MIVRLLSPVPIVILVVLLPALGEWSLLVFHLSRFRQECRLLQHLH